MKSTILITGTAGFIGYHLARRLLAKGHQVVGIDNLNDYYSVPLKKERHSLLRQHASFVSKEMDMCDSEAVNTAFRDYAPSMVCHLAAQPGIRYSLINPLMYQKSNVEGFITVLENARQHGIKRFVYASSSSVYGNSTELPLSEKQRVDAPLNLYAATKKSNELMAHAYHHLYGMTTVGLRFFTVYGEWGRPEMSYWLFTEAILNDEPIKVFNDGNMRRDFTYIDDIIDGIESSLFNMNLSGNHIFNLGNNKTEYLHTMISILEDAIGKKAKKIMMPIQPGDMVDTYADISLAVAELSFHPKTSIKDGLPRFVEWYLRHKGIAGPKK